MSDTTFWILTICLGIGTFLIRFSFLGILGGRQMPDWALLHLKYVGVAVFPALAVPLILWPEAPQTAMDPLRIVAAAMTLFAAMRGSIVTAIAAGMGTLYLGRLLINYL